MSNNNVTQLATCPDWCNAHVKPAELPNAGSDFPGLHRASFLWEKRFEDFPTATSVWITQPVSEELEQVPEIAYTNGPRMEIPNSFTTQEARRFAEALLAAVEVVERAPERCSHCSEPTMTPGLCFRCEHEAEREIRARRRSAIHLVTLDD
jgi:hypothetical protein